MQVGMGEQGERTQPNKWLMFMWICASSWVGTQRERELRGSSAIEGRPMDRGTKGEQSKWVADVHAVSAVAHEEQGSAARRHGGHEGSRFCCQTVPTPLACKTFSAPCCHHPPTHPTCNVAQDHHVTLLHRLSLDLHSRRQHIQHELHCLRRQPGSCSSKAARAQQLQ